MVPTSSLTTAHGQTAGITIGHLWRAGALAAPLAAVSGLAIRAIGVAVGAVPAHYQPLQPLPIVIVSVMAALVASGLLAALARWARRPILTFRLIALGGLLLSFGGPLQAGAGTMQGGAASGATVATMLLMHVVAAVVIVGLLTILGHTTQRRRERS
jgi:Family of unknown function (DUF6069)